MLRETLVIVGVVVGSQGCVQLLGLDEVRTTIDGGTPDALQFDAMVDPFACAAQESLPATGTVMGSTEAEDDSLELSCGSSSSNDALFAWKAPASDYYVFDTKGSNFDTVLGLLDECDGNEIACHRNVNTTSEAEIVIKLELNEEVLVAVDGYAGASGAFSLNVERVSCPNFDLEDQVLPLEFSTTGSDDDFFNECGGDGQEDRAFHWVAPSDGLFAFTAVAPGYRAIVSLLDGTRCSDTQLGCSQANQANFRSEVVRRLGQGQAVSVYVDGVEGAGNFSLDVQKIDITCPSEILPVGRSDSSFETRTMSSSCSFVEARNSVNIREELQDKTFQVDVPAANAGCIGSCDIEILSATFFSAAILEGNDCSGVELQCKSAELGRVSLTLDMLETKETSYTLLVSSLEGGGGDFSVTQGCFLACF